MGINIRKDSTAKDDEPQIATRTSTNIVGESSEVDVNSVDQLPEYKTYKRRWIGLIEITLMNIMVSWDSYSPVAGVAADYFDVSLTAINWMSTGYLFAFVAAFPFTLWTLHRGIKLSTTVCAFFLILGSWVRYAGTTSTAGGNYTPALIGNLLTGIAQPFVLCAPTKYSDMWFTSRGRVLATATMTLANPIGGALSNFINPLWVNSVGDISHLTLYVSIMATAVCVPIIFMPSKPPTPVGPASVHEIVPLWESFKRMSGSLELYLVIIPFTISTGLFNGFVSLIAQEMHPYGYSYEQAGIGGAILIFAGLGTSLLAAPILDRTHKFLLVVRILVPIVALTNFVFIWMPRTRTLAGPYAVLGINGAATFTLLPLILEFLTDLVYPISPEVATTLIWVLGNLLGGIVIIVENYLRDGPDASPPYNNDRALIFQGVIALLVAPVFMSVGAFGRKDKVVLKRFAIEEAERKRRAELSVSPEAGIEKTS